MRKPEKPSPAEAEFLFEIDPERARETMTSWGGIPLLVRAFRSLGLAQSVKQHVQIRQRQRGYDEAAFVESFVTINAVGGDCLDDFERLREDGGLAEMLGHEIPSPEAARKFLYQFHDEKKIVEAKQQLALGQVAYIPGENAALAGLGQVNFDLIAELGRRCAEHACSAIARIHAEPVENNVSQAFPKIGCRAGYQLRTRTMERAVPLLR